MQPATYEFRVRGHLDAAAVVGLIAFILVELRAREPIIPLRLFRNVGDPDIAEAFAALMGYHPEAPADATGAALSAALHAPRDDGGAASDATPATLGPA